MALTPQAEKNTTRSKGWRGDRRKRKGENGLGRGEEEKWGEDRKRKRKNKEGGDEKRQRKEMGKMELESGLSFS